MLAFGTNVLLYAADDDSEYRERYRSGRRDCGCGRPPSRHASIGIGQIGDVHRHPPLGCGVIPGHQSPAGGQPRVVPTVGSCCRRGRHRLEGREMPMWGKRRDPLSSAIVGDANPGTEKCLQSAE